MNDGQRTYPPDLGMIYLNRSSKGVLYGKGYLKRKDGTKLEVYGTLRTKPGVDKEGRPITVEWLSITEYVARDPSIPYPNKPAYTPVPAAAPIEQPVIDDDIPF